MNEKLTEWKDIYTRDETEWQKQLDRMAEWEEQYDGRNDVEPVTRNGKPDKTPHVRNVTAELVEAQVDSTLPHPKVTAMRKEDELLAATIENMLRNEMDRLPMEEINDLATRMVIIDGGAFYHVEWDESRRTHLTAGESVVRALHPIQVVPQSGIFTGLDDMEHIFIRMALTRSYVERRYRVKVELETEERPDIRGRDAQTADDIVTVVVCYYRNRKGGIGRFSWCNDTVLEDLEDYQARRAKVCPKCGVLASEFVTFEESGLEQYGDVFGEPEPDERMGKKVCPICGGEKATEKSSKKKCLPSL